MMVMLMKNIVWGRMIRTQTNMLLRKVDSIFMIMMMLRKVDTMMMMMLRKVDTAFKMFDKNKDGFITKEEFAQVHRYCRKSFVLLKHQKGRSKLCVSVSVSTDTTLCEVL